MSFCVAGVPLTGWRSWARIWRLGRRATLRGRRGTTSHPPSFHVAGVAQTHMYRRFAWQACHLWYWVARLGPDLPGAPRHFAWQAWHNFTSSFHVAGVAQTHMYRRFVWQACHHWVARFDLAPGAPRHFAWQAWHNLTSTFVSRGTLSTQSSASSSSRPLSHPHSLLSTHSLSTHSLSRTLCPHTLCPHTLCPHTLCPHTLCPHTLCLSIHTLSTHSLSTHSLSTHSLSTHTLSTHTLSTHSLSTHSLSHTLCPHTLCHTLFVHTHFVHTLFVHTLFVHTLFVHTHFVNTLFVNTLFVNTHCVHLRFTWQAWHKLTCTVVLCGRRATYGTGWRAWARIWRLGRRATLRGRRGTTSHPPSFHVAGVAQTHMYRRFAWQACHLWYWVARLGPDLAPGAPRHFAWQAWHNFTSPHIHLRSTWQVWHKLTSNVVLRGRRATYGTGWRSWARIWRLGRPATLRGRRGTTSHPPSFHVAGVAQTHMYRRFAWQACHLWYWVARLGPDLAPGAPRHFAWQAWHNFTSTFVSRGRRGTNSHVPSFCVAGVPLMVLGGALGPGFGAWGAAPFCVAGVAQPDIHFRFTWHFVNTLFVHTLFVTHSLSTHTLSTHSLSTHSLSTHSLSTHTLSTHSLSTLWRFCWCML